jgi:RNA polymerase sigma-70 factor (ECF subfamily)
MVLTAPPLDFLFRWWAERKDSCNFPAPRGVGEGNDDAPVPPSSSGLNLPHAAFTTFMRQHQDKVFSTALRLTRNRAQAEDIAQEVFIKAHDHFANLEHNPAASGWLRTVATNLSLNHLTRYRNRWRFFSEFRRDDDTGEAAPELEFAAPETFFTAIEAADRQVLVARALDALPDHQRVPLVLFRFEDMPYDEIARRLGVSLAKVKTDILRGRSALARRLAQDAELQPFATPTKP